MIEKVIEIMTRDVISVTVNTTVREVIDVFREFKIDSVPVLESGVLVGLFSKSSVYKAFLNEAGLDDIIEPYIKKDVKVICPDAKIEDALAIEVGRLPVVNSERKLVGILTRSDLMACYARRAEEFSTYLQTVLDSTYNAIIAINLDGHISIFNKSAEKFTSWSAENAIGRHINEVIPNTGLLEVLKTGKPMYAQKMDLGPCRVISNRSPIYYGGELSGAVGVVQDISSLEIISEELQTIKNLNSELETIIESCHDAIIVADQEGKLEKLNSSYERITGIKVTDLVNKNLRELEDQGVLSQSVSLLVIKECKPVTILQKLNTGREIIVTGTPVKDGNGNIIKVVTTGRDMTELSSLKDELEKTKELSNKYYNELMKLKNQLNNHTDEVVFSSEKMRQLVKLCIRIAEVESSVLLLGESGVGKEVLARIIHNSSGRKGNLFVKINCGAIPENLLETELFGYEEGAFTGAKKGGKPGLFEVAHKGTLFLDEIGELPLNLQVKFLRVLQEQEITRIGGSTPISVDVRIITATNRDLMAMLKDGSFRQDLYYRLNVVPIKAPPLRERREDILPLAHYFLQRFNKKYHTTKRFSPDVLDDLLEYDWPGNVRELENIIERLVVISDASEIKRNQLPFAEEEEVAEEEVICVNKIIPLKTAVELVEKILISRALEKYGTTRKAADILEVNASTVARKAAKIRIV